MEVNDIVVRLQTVERAAFKRQCAHIALHGSYDALEITNINETKDRIGFNQ